MVKFDLEVFKHMTSAQWRVLTAVEMGMKNHDLVPTDLIEAISSLKRGGAFREISFLHKNKFLAHESKRYDGYRLKSSGYDFLALRALVRRGTLAAVGRQIGTGKESDVYEAVTPDGQTVVLKLHRLGRTSFRKIKEKRDYLGKRKAASWLYMSRLSALREFAYMKSLWDRDFPVPEPLDVSRHAVVMTLAPGLPLSSIRELQNPKKVFRDAMETMLRLGAHGLVHCDFNEFNLMLEPETEHLTLIDFPQMVSTDHPEAQKLFDRDVDCLRYFFSRKFDYVDEDGAPSWENVVVGEDGAQRLDEDVQASGFGGELDALAGLTTNQGDNPEPRDTENDSESDSNDENEDLDEENEDKTPSNDPRQTRKAALDYDQLETQERMLTERLRLAKQQHGQPLAAQNSDSDAEDEAPQLVDASAAPTDADETASTVSTQRKGELSAHDLAFIQKRVKQKLKDKERRRKHKAAAKRSTRNKQKAQVAYDGW